jgi:hypothetical protein
MLRLLLRAAPAEDPAARELNYAERRGAMYLLFCAELPAPCPAATRTSSVVQESAGSCAVGGEVCGIEQARSTAPSMVQWMMVML